MRILTILFILIISISAKAQSFVPLSFMDMNQRAAFNHNSIKDSSQKSKWSLNMYSSVSTSFVFYKGGHASVFSAPITLQLNRKLNDNLYAFAAVSAAPAYINFSNTFLSTDISKFSHQNNFYKTGNFGVSARADIGLMYVNDAKTFSISGSIGIEKDSYPAFQYNQFNPSKQNPAIRSPNR
ncbi:hypothetical protein BH09BAC5_BH09BAC5_27570 [soil metagenome]